MKKNSKVKVMACSGVGKVYGLMAREAVMRTVTQLCPEQADTTCLAYIVTGDDAATALVAGQPCITIDGCPAMCSAKSVAAMGGDIRAEFKVLDTMRLHKGAKAGTATALTEEGWAIVDEMAAVLHETVQEIQDGRR